MDFTTHTHTEREREREHDSLNREETPQQSSLKFPARTLTTKTSFSGWHRRPARLFNCAPRINERPHGSPLHHRGSSRCLDAESCASCPAICGVEEAEGGGKVGAESQRSGKGWRPIRILSSAWTRRAATHSRHGPLLQTVRWLRVAAQDCDISLWGLTGNMCAWVV